MSHCALSTIYSLQNWGFSECFGDLQHRKPLVNPEPTRVGEV
ncbi:hypothetical protein JCM19239_7159 [Vibrio variabilis]|uniref:Uncharacterized protein n=1 Tax=Vibrio variabilis TaxID=990271 RepID=A0ABQ0JK47_9VIBR|nr:hypothetical protein JCM19239_7159 [Vibrio variabilis]